MTQAGGVHSELDMLYRALHQLAQAASPPEQLQAVSDYARESGAAMGILIYADENGTAREVAAEWATEASSISTGTPMLLAVTRLALRPHTHFSEPLLIRDVLLDDQLDADSRAVCADCAVRALAVLPLRGPRGLMGALLFCWYKPVHFNERDLRIYKALQQQAIPAIDSVRLHQQNQRLREHNRLISDMNDSVLQALYGIWLGARTARTLFDRDPTHLAEPLDYIVSLAKSSLMKTRALGMELRADRAESLAQARTTSI